LDEQHLLFTLFMFLICIDGFMKNLETLLLLKTFFKVEKCSLDY